MRTGALVVLVAVGCGAPAAPAPAPIVGARAAVTGAAVTDQVSAMLDDWHAAAADADEARYFGHFAAFGVFLGTDGTERWTVPEFRNYAHPHFERKKAWKFRASRREITFVGEVAWFDEDLLTENLGPARGTGVVVREGGVWKVAQYNLSVPIPNDRFKSVRALIDGAASAP